MGKVVSISKSPIAVSDLPFGYANALAAHYASNEPLYRITVHIPKQKVHLKGQSFELKVGMTFEADIKHETRRLWEIFALR